MYHRIRQENSFFFFFFFSGRGLSSDIYLDGTDPVGCLRQVLTFLPASLSFSARVAPWGVSVLP